MGSKKAQAFMGDTYSDTRSDGIGTEWGKKTKGIYFKFLMLQELSREHYSLG